MLSLSEYPTLKNTLNFLAFSNIFIATAAALQVFSFSGDLDQNDQILLSVFVFCATLFIYTQQRMWKRTRKRVKSDRHSWIRNNKKLQQAFTIIGAVGVAATFHVFPLSFIAFGVVLGITTFAYIGKPKDSKSGLRNFGFLKLMIVGGVWGSVLVIFPAIIKSGLEFKNDMIVFLRFMERFMFIIILTIPFDIRDMKTDSRHVRTLPRMVGVDSSKIFGYLVGAGGIVFLWLMPEVGGAFAYPFILMYVLACVLLWKSEYGKRSDLFYSIGVDGLLIIDALLRIFLFREMLPQNQAIPTLPPIASFSELHQTLLLLF